MRWFCGYRSMIPSLWYLLPTFCYWVTPRIDLILKPVMLSVVLYLDMNHLTFVLCHTPSPLLNDLNKGLSSISLCRVLPHWSLRLASHFGQDIGKVKFCQRPGMLQWPRFLKKTWHLVLNNLNTMMLKMIIILVFVVWLNPLRHHKSRIKVLTCIIWYYFKGILNDNMPLLLREY